MAQNEGDEKMHVHNSTVLQIASLLGNREPIRREEGTIIYMPSINETVPSWLYNRGLGDIPSEIASKIVKLYNLIEHHSKLRDEGKDRSDVANEICDNVGKLMHNDYAALNRKLKEIVDNAMDIALLVSLENQFAQQPIAENRQYT